MEFDIKNLKDAFVSLAGVANSIHDIAEDGTVDLTEVMGALIENQSGIIDIVRNFKDIRNELLDLQNQERIEIDLAVADALKIDGEKASQIVSGAFGLLTSAGHMVAAFDADEEESEEE